MFNFEICDLDSITIEDIAGALSKLPRFNGQTRHTYTVAEHSVAVAARLNKRIALEGLLHDAAEAYVGDMTGPLQMVVPGFKVICRRVELAIQQKFGLVYAGNDRYAVAEADREELHNEMRFLFRDTDFRPLPSDVIECNFLDTFRYLKPAYHPHDDYS